MEKVVLAIGRWMPIHLGHKQFLVDLATRFDRLVIGIGSCYENGTPRNCIPAVEREKLLRRIMRAEGISDDKVIIVPVEDRPTFEEWIGDVVRICEHFGVTHFCTGNKEDILNELERKGIDLHLEMINPETDSAFPYHATDIRMAILNEEYERLDGMIPHEIKDIVIRQIAKEIIRASKGEGQAFIPGRQTVDMVVLVKNPSDEQVYLLIGTRDADKIDFANADALPGGGIAEMESPIHAAIRVLEREAGLVLELTDNTDEPAKVILPQLGGRMEDLHFIGIYASPDTRVNGTRGGGSQCFAFLLEADLEMLTPLLHSRHDLSDLRFIKLSELKDTPLAYEQDRMVSEAVSRLQLNMPAEEQLAVFSEDGTPTGERVSRSAAHRDGVLHGAAHTYIYRIVNGKVQLLLQRRSADKDSFPNCLDISSAGHVEFGMDFTATAQKELMEELGLSAPAKELREIGVLRFSAKDVFHGRVFDNQEINAVYLWHQDPPLSSLRFQESEVSEAVWMDIDEIDRRLRSNDSELCLDRREFDLICRAISENT